MAHLIGNWKSMTTHDLGGSKKQEEINHADENSRNNISQNIFDDDDESVSSTLNGGERNQNDNDDDDDADDDGMEEPTPQLENPRQLARFLGEKIERRMRQIIAKEEEEATQRKRRNRKKKSEKKTFNKNQEEKGETSDAIHVGQDQDDSDSLESVNFSEASSHHNIKSSCRRGNDIDSASNLSDDDDAVNPLSSQETNDGSHGNSKMKNEVGKSNTSTTHVKTRDVLDDDDEWW